MPPRSVKRRGAGQRWLLVPLALTILVVLADASMHARSAKAQVALSTDAWVGKVLPEIGTSSTQGREVADLTTAPLHEGAAPVAAGLARIALSARATYRDVERAVPPSKLEGAAGLLDACLSAREKGAAEMSTAVQDLMTGGKASEGTAVADMEQAVSDFAVSDNAYRLFAQQAPALGFRLPSSVWDLGAAHYGPSSFDTFAARFLSGRANAAPHQLAIDSLSTDPAALSMQGQVEVLPPAAALYVTVVVSDTGSSAADGVTVSVTITPALGAASQTRSATVDLAAGGSRSVVLGGLAMAQSKPVELEAAATEPAGEPGSASRHIAIEMAGSNFDASPTTGTPGTTTTPGGTSVPEVTTTSTGG